MAKATLATNFQDDILNSSMGNKRRYNLIQNSDGTVSLEDVSTYDQVGSEYGAGQVNAVNKAVNESADAGKIIDDVDDIDAVTKEGYIAGALALKAVNSSLGGLKFGIDGDGNYGYYGADDSLIPFRSSESLVFSDTIIIQADNKGIKLKSNLFNLWSSTYGAFSINVKKYDKVHVIVNSKASLLNTYMLGTNSIDAISGDTLDYIPASTNNDRYKDVTLDVSSYDWFCIYCPYYANGQSDATQTVVIDKLELL